MYKMQCILILFLLSLMHGGVAHAQWVQTSGPYGGVILSFAVSGTNLFAGTYEDGVFLSTNNGTSWTEVNTGLTNTVILALAVSPDSSGNLFAGTGDGGVFLSTNNGTSWTEVNNGLTNTSVRALAVSGTNLFAGTGGGVFLSTNNGTSWTEVNTGLTNTGVNHNGLAVSGTNLFAGTFDGGVFLSTNNGTSWTEVNTGLTNRNVCALAVSGTNLFAGTGGGVFLSTNNGASWTSTGLTNTDIFALAVSPDSSGNLFAGTGDGCVFLSTNNGTSWTVVKTGLPNTRVRALAVSGTNLFAGTWWGGGVFLSTNNGTNWTVVNNGLTNRNVSALAVSPDSSGNLFAGTQGGVFLSTNNGTNWTSTGLTNTNVSALAMSGTNLLAGTYDSGVFLSTNNGKSWTAINMGLTNTHVSALAVSPNSSGNLFAATYGGVFLSTNNGKSWTTTGMTRAWVCALAVSGRNLFAGTEGEGVFLSTNGGKIWTEVNNGLTNTHVSALAVSPDSSGNLFAGTGGGVFLSTNNGKNWIAVNTGLTNKDINAFAVSGTNLFAGTWGGGVFRSASNGTSWTAATCSTAAAATYYVSPSGSDSSPGTSVETAWQTVDRANAVDLNPGDKVLFESGHDYPGNLLLTAEDAGTPEHPVVIGSYGSGRARIKAGDGSGVTVLNAGGVVVENLIVLGTNYRTNVGSGIKIANELPNNQKLHYVRIHNVEASGFGRKINPAPLGFQPTDGCGIFVGGHASDGSKSGYSNVRITNCVTYQNEYFGILTSGYWQDDPDTYANGNVYVGYCMMYDNPGDPNFYENHSGSGILMEDVDGGMIEYCVAYQNGYECGCRIGGPVGIWAAVANNVTIQYCESHHNRSGNEYDGGGFDFDGGTTNSVLQYNYSHDNAGAGYLICSYKNAPHSFKNNTVRYNISVNDVQKSNQGAINLWTGSPKEDPIHDTRIYGNTIYTTRAPAITFQARAGIYNTQVFNNLFVTANNQKMVAGDPNKSVATFAGNAYWSIDGEFGFARYRSLKDWQEARGQEMLSGKPVGLVVDPQLTDPGKSPSIDDPTKLHTLTAYQLQKDSPLVDAGLDLRSLFDIHPGGRDFYGNSIPQGKGYDVGAHELNWK
ncbi:MAG TPA: hypothetical protein VM123_11755 [archaeon]|nr:hypothetical protein [archaeon]